MTQAQKESIKDSSPEELQTIAEEKQRKEEQKMKFYLVQDNGNDTTKSSIYEPGKNYEANFAGITVAGEVSDIQADRIFEEEKAHISNKETALDIQDFNLDELGLDVAVDNVVNDDSFDNNLDVTITKDGEIQRVFFGWLATKHIKDTDILRRSADDPKALDKLTIYMNSLSTAIQGMDALNEAGMLKDENVLTADQLEISTLLPVDEEKKYTKEFINKLKGKYKVKFNRTEYAGKSISFQLTENNIKVQKECFTSIVGHFYKDNGEQDLEKIKKTFGIKDEHGIIKGIDQEGLILGIDIGSITCDLVIVRLLKSGNKIISSVQLPNGIFHAIDSILPDITKYINEQSAQGSKFEATREIIMSAIFNDYKIEYGGKLFDIKEYVRPRFDALARDLKIETDKLFPSANSKLHLKGIMLLGGGAELFEDLITERFDDHFKSLVIPLDDINDAPSVWYNAHMTMRLVKSNIK